MPTLHWFEIPVHDIERASKFYASILGTDVPVMDMMATMGSMIGMLPRRDDNGGALVQNMEHGYEPSNTGTLVYLVTDLAMDTALENAEKGGGEIVMAKTPMGEDKGSGFISWIIDTEGNKVGLYAAE